MQYDTQSAGIGWQARFRWIVRPGNDFYFVYIQNWLDDPVTGRIHTVPGVVRTVTCVAVTG